MSRSLREVDWPRFLRAPDGELVARLYEPALRRAVRYDRCCAYFSSSVLAAAASGFGAFIQRILDGEIARKPALRLLVNEELAEADVRALVEAGEDGPLIEALLARLGTPETALQKARLEMLAWLAREGWLEVKVGLLRQGYGLLHAKFGLFVDAAEDAVVFAGSGNESASGIRANYEMLEISRSWADPERHERLRAEFETLWSGADPAVAGRAAARGGSARVDQVRAGGPACCGPRGQSPSPARCHALGLCDGSALHAGGRCCHL
jgi:hypothetical protein